MPVKAAPPAVAIFTWTGCYVGVHGGGAWANKRWYSGNGFEFIDREHDIDGFLVGGQVGCQVQYNQWVIGVEGQAAWADLDGSVTVGTGTAAVTYGTEADIVGSFAFRTGWAFNRTLLYYKTGVGFIHERHFIAGPTGIVTQQTDQFIRLGLMAGAGIEHAFGNNWSAKVEYNYTRFGIRTEAICFVAVVQCEDNRFRQHMHLVKVGINYRWGGGAVVARY